MPSAPLGRLDGGPSPLLGPAKPKAARKPQILLRLHEPHNSKLRQLAGLRGQALGPLVAEILIRVIPQALAEEMARAETDVGNDEGLQEAGAGGA